MLGPDIYVRDLTTGVVDLVTVNETGDGSGNDWSLDPGDFSPDGSRLAFTRPASTSCRATPTRVPTCSYEISRHGRPRWSPSTAAGTGVGNAGTEYGTSFSPDGDLLAFTSRASDLVTTDTNEAGDVFVRDLATGTTSLLSINAAGTDSARGTITGFNDSTGPVFSPEGHWIAFTSNASDFGPIDTDNDGDLFIDTDIYVRDLTTGSTTLVSTNAEGTDSDRGRSEQPIFTGDGGKLLFEGDGNPLGGQPTTSEWGQLYMKDLTTGHVTVVSASADGTVGSNGGSRNASISADGLTIAFESGASNLGPSDSNSRTDIYVAGLHGADLATTLTPMHIGSPRDTTTLEVTLDNQEPEDAPGSNATMLLPPSLTFLSARSDTGSCTSPPPEHPGLVVCLLGDLPAGETASVTVTTAVTAVGGNVVVVGSSRRDRSRFDQQPQ